VLISNTEAVLIRRLQYSKVNGAPSTPRCPTGEQVFVSAWLGCAGLQATVLPLAEWFRRAAMLTITDEACW
jgi:hypothetical protein